MSKILFYTIISCLVHPLLAEILPWRISYPSGDYLEINNRNFDIVLVSKPILSHYSINGLTQDDLKHLNLPKEIFKEGNIVLCGIDSEGNLVLFKRIDSIFVSLAYAYVNCAWVQVAPSCDPFFSGLLIHMNQFTSFGYEPIVEISKIEFRDIALLDKNAISAYKTLAKSMELVMFDKMIKIQLQH